jgi:hypothetical protein
MAADLENEAAAVEAGCVWRKEKLFNIDQYG